MKSIFILLILVITQIFFSFHPSVFFIKNTFAKLFHFPNLLTFYICAKIFRGHSLAEFDMKWRHWREECARRLEDGEFAGCVNLEKICRVSLGFETGMYFHLNLVWQQWNKATLFLCIKMWLRTEKKKQKWKQLRVLCNIWYGLWNYKPHFGTNFTKYQLKYTQQLKEKWK